MRKRTSAKHGQYRLYVGGGVRRFSRVLPGRLPVGCLWGVFANVGCEYLEHLWTIFR